MNVETFTESHWPAVTSTPIIELTIGALLREAAAEFPDRAALVEAVPPGFPSLSGASRTDRSWTYAELLGDAEQCAQWLLERFAPGERITVWAPNIPEWVILEYGAALAGLVLVTANPALRASELAHVVRQSKSSGIFFAAAFRGTEMTGMVHALVDVPQLRERVCFDDWETTVRSWRGETHALPAVQPGDAAQIQYTSGTTGRPKAAVLHHRGMAGNARFFTERLGISGGPWIGVLPLFHTTGSVMSVLGCATTRATYVLCQFFEAEFTLKCMQDWRAQYLLGVPTMLIAVADHPRAGDYDLSACRLILSGGSPVQSELVRRLEAQFSAKFSIVFGQTEAGPLVTQTRPDDSLEDRANTIGQPLPQVEVKIIDPGTGRVAAIGEQGELCTRGFQTMLGYYDMPEATADAIDADGWLHTGDIAAMDERGFFTIAGRLKDMIIRGGENIYPREIEEILFAHAKIADIAVVGVPDPHWGEQAAAVLRPSDAGDPPTAAELHAYCRNELAPHKTPHFWYLTEEFPLTGSGKIQKFRLVELIAAGAYRALQ